MIPLLTCTIAVKVLTVFKEVHTNGRLTVLPVCENGEYKSGRLFRCILAIIELSAEGRIPSYVALRGKANQTLGDVETNCNFEGGILYYKKCSGKKTATSNKLRPISSVCSLPAEHDVMMVQCEQCD